MARSLSRVKMVSEICSMRQNCNEKLSLIDRYHRARKASLIQSLVGKGAAFGVSRVAVDGLHIGPVKNHRARRSAIRHEWRRRTFSVYQRVANSHDKCVYPRRHNADTNKTFLLHLLLRRHASHAIFLKRKQRPFGRDIFGAQSDFQRNIGRR